MWNPLRARRERRQAHLVEREAFRAAKRLAREDVLDGHGPLLHAAIAEAHVRSGLGAMGIQVGGTI